jgi:cis-zeatin O-glucosyltransferase
MDSAAVAIVTVSFPAQGHLNQLLQLSPLLAWRGFPIHFAAPEPHLREARARLHGWAPTPRWCVSTRWTCPRTTPPPPFPAHMQPLFEAFCTGAQASLVALERRRRKWRGGATHRRKVLI